MNKTVKWQLAIFAVLTVIGLVVMSVVYLRVPTALGYNRTDLSLDMPDTGGLYPDANVSYLGSVIGGVDEVALERDGVRADLHIKSDVGVPANVRAEIRSVSAVGEQYVELVPDGRPEGSLDDGTTIARDRVSMPQGIGPVLDQANALVASVDDQKMKRVLDEAFRAFDGSDRDMQRLIDSARLFLQEARSNSEVTTKLIEDAEPLLDSQNRSADSLRSWTRNLANVTDQLRTDEPQLTSIMNRGPGALERVTKTLDDLQPTMPVLVANLVSIGEVGVTYNRSIEQVLVLYPAIVAALITAIDGGKETHEIKVDFNLQINKTPPCTTGFIPAADRRSPADLSVPAQINDLYCKVPADSPIAVRGARNFPCMAYPGRRGASPEQCAAGGYSSKDVLGDNPPDVSEVGPADNAIHPPGQDPPGTVPTASNTQNVPTPTSAFPNGGANDRQYAAPATQSMATSAAVYDPESGEYVASDGKTYSQSDLGTATKIPPGATMTEVMTNGVTAK